MKIVVHVEVKEIDDKLANPHEALKKYRLDRSSMSPTDIITMSLEQAMLMGMVDKEDTVGIIVAGVN